MSLCDMWPSPNIVNSVMRKLKVLKLKTATLWPFVYRNICNDVLKMNLYIKQSDVTRKMKSRTKTMSLVVITQEV